MAEPVAKVPNKVTVEFSLNASKTSRNDYASCTVNLERQQKDGTIKKVELVRSFLRADQVELLELYGFDLVDNTK